MFLKFHGQRRALELVVITLYIENKYKHNKPETIIGTPMFMFTYNYE